MRPRSLTLSIVPGFEQMYQAMYRPQRGISVYAPGWLRMRDVVRRTHFRLRVWIRRTLRRFTRLPMLVINPDGQIFGLAIPQRLYRRPASVSTLIVQMS